MNLARYIRFGVLAFVLVAVSVSAQPKFLVMSAKGKVEFKVEGSKWKSVKVGMELPSQATVKTSYSSYVKFMMGKNRLVGIDENTTKQLADFARAMNQGKESKTNTILAYAAKQMKRDRTRQTETEFGAVRGDMEVFNATFPKYAVMSGNPAFRIVDESRSHEYEIALYDTDMNLVAKPTIQSESFVYPDTGSPLVPGKTYYWKATRVADGLMSDVQRFTIVHPDTVAFIKNELENLDSELTEMGADSVMHHLIRGVYFEQKQLYYNAFLEYRRTVHMAPGVQEYRDMLSALLLTLSLHNEEEYLIMD
jgi:hypothetical protein